MPSQLLTCRGGPWLTLGPPRPDHHRHTQGGVRGEGTQLGPTVMQTLARAVLRDFQEEGVTASQDTTRSRLATDPEKLRAPLTDGNNEEDLLLRGSS
jgi:hypothetical protein